MGSKIKRELKKLADPEKAQLLARYFKTSKGDYGEGDKFLGLVMPMLRAIAGKYYDQISIPETLKLLQGKFHEERMLALLILMLKYKKGAPATRKQIFKAYLAHTKFINNWDLVDVTCRDIVGAYLSGRNRKMLYQLAKSKNLWEKRIAIISTFYFISKNDLTDSFKLAKILLNDKHDLIHKAVGWTLREAGKKNKTLLVRFLEENISHMPRTTLRYAIEKFSPAERAKFLYKN